MSRAGRSSDDYWCVLEVFIDYLSISWYDLTNIGLGGGDMAISYNKLWKLLIDKKMKKKDLQRASGISSSSVAKLGRNENVNTETLQKICTALHCDVCDIMQIEYQDNI